MKDEKIIVTKSQLKRLVEKSKVTKAMKSDKASVKRVLLDVHSRLSEINRECNDVNVSPKYIQKKIIDVLYLLKEVIVVVDDIQ